MKNNFEKIILGTANFINGYGLANEPAISPSELRKIFQFCKNKEIFLFDTAPVYGNAEELLGRLGSNMNHFITKIPKLSSSLNTQRKEIISILKKSKENLKIKKFHAILFHDMQHLLSLPKPFINDLIENIFQENLASKVGISIYDPNEIEMVLDIFLPAIIQSPCNVFDQRILSDKFSNLIKSLDAELHIRSVFLQGLLIDEGNMAKSYFSEFSQYIRGWFDYCKSIKVSPVSASLSFALAKDGIDKIVVGFANMDQLSEITSIISLNMSKDQIINYHPSFELGLIDPRLWQLN